MNTIDEYISGFPKEVQLILEQVRNTIKKAAPDAEECISWEMPTFRQDGNVVHFAGHKSHVGFYPGASGIEVFKEELSGYKTSKGAAQFPLNKPMPLKLIAKIVKYRVKENLEIAASKDKSGFLLQLPAPARRALEGAKITSLKKLSHYSETEILKFHGMGKSSIPELKKALEEKGLQFKSI